MVSPFTLLICLAAGTVSSSQWRLLLQTMGKAGKGKKWAEYKLESILSVPSLISESIIMEDDDEGSTPGSTPAKGSPRPVGDEEWQDKMKAIGRPLLGTVRQAASSEPLTAAKLDATLRRWAR